MELIFAEIGNGREAKFIAGSEFDFFLEGLRRIFAKECQEDIGLVIAVRDDYPVITVITALGKGADLIETVLPSVGKLLGVVNLVLVKIAGEVIAKDGN